MMNSIWFVGTAKKIYEETFNTIYKKKAPDLLATIPVLYFSSSLK